MNDLLSEKYHEYKKNYSNLKEWLADSAIEEFWGVGTIPAYSLEPYSSELQGNTPGKILGKKKYSPAKNRQKLFLDSNGDIIGEIRYSKFIERKNDWIVYRSFYLRSENEVIGLIFGSALENKDDAILNKIILVELDGGIIKKSYSHSYDNKKSERSYIYNDNIITNIEERVWLNKYVEHFYSIEKIEPLKIVEKVQSEVIPIYPE